MKKILFFVIAILFTTNLLAQTKFTEGKIIYDIFITSDLKEEQGKLFITVKNGIIKRELKMNNGYTNIIFYNADINESWVFNEKDGAKFSKKISTQDLEAQNKKFENANYDFTNEEKIIAGKTTKKCIVKYTDGTSNVIYYAQDLSPSIKEFNAMFDKISGLPLQYEVTAGGNNKMFLVANKVELVPVDDIELEMPKGYKVIGK